MKDFELPVPEYCSLERAARLIGSGCEVEDILHWAEVGAINLSCKFKGNEEYKSFISFKGDVLDIAKYIFNTGQKDDYWINLSQFSMLSSSQFEDCQSVNDVAGELTKYSDTPRAQGGLVGVWDLDSYIVDHDRTSPYTRVLCKPFGGGGVDALAKIPEEIGFSERNLLISKKNISKILGRHPRELTLNLQETKKIEDNESSRTVAKNRASMIKALLAIHYGENIANNPRAFIDNADSKITKDFALKGISLPTGKTIATWLQDADIEFK